MNKNTVDNHELERTLPADLGAPQPVINPGKMRSDRIPLPTGVTKHEADQAEVQEAREQGITAPGQPPIIRTFAADNCRTYWPSSFQVCGAIRAKYESMAVTWAGQTPVSFLGLPKSNELTNPDGVGKRTEFDNGFIYWHPDTGAWSVTTHNSIVWARNGWELGRLGYPTSDEIGTGDGVGRKQYFQRGRIYGSLSGVVSIEGKILEKWVETGEERGPLGYPATDEEGTPDGVGRYNRFALGMIYWHPSYGAHTILDLILEAWSISGYERGRFGYPVSDAYNDEFGGPVQDFEHQVLVLENELDAAGTSMFGGKQLNNLLIQSLQRRFVAEADIANLTWSRNPVWSPNDSPNIGTFASISRTESIPPWAACGFTTSEDKVIKSWTGNYGVHRGHKIDLKCGPRDGQTSGFRHIKRRHMKEWQTLAAIEGIGWMDLADMSMTKAFTDADYWKNSQERNSTCYSAQVYLVDKVRGTIAMTIDPSSIVSDSNDLVVTSFPGGKCHTH
ncbi:LGFP repeat-containing protein [Corynebacterium epidermidicanis]|uniref:LGFP repeat protein n=1 Tax=Corynebacterium epidermidicanis TaxID=1050174 RepID=A0A0G3GMJ0_9CORY|nr:LGFP repeat-containing protein [Corynebacterium epidermidicanis]AKK02359.1 LGFP repeat protein [Corynebacterium epidermidicanis]